MFGTWNVLAIGQISEIANFFNSIGSIVSSKVHLASRSNVYATLDGGASPAMRLGSLLILQLVPWHTGVVCFLQRNLQLVPRHAVYALLSETRLTCCVSALLAVTVDRSLKKPRWRLLNQHLLCSSYNKRLRFFFSFPSTGSKLRGRNAEGSD